MKKLVNDWDMYSQFITYINEKISIAQKALEVNTEIHDVYRLQGEIRALRKLLYIREEINGVRDGR